VTSSSQPVARAAGAQDRLSRRDLLTLGVRPPAASPAVDGSPAVGTGTLAPAAAAAPREDDGGHWIRVYRAAMACRFEITLAGEDARHVPAARDALREADRLEASLSVFRDTSDLTRINRSAADAPVDVDAELFALLARCRELHAETGGAFDITSTPLSRCWGFLVRQGRLPSAADIEAARARVGMDAVTLSPSPQTPLPRERGLNISLSPMPGRGQGEGQGGASRVDVRTVYFARPGIELNLGSIGKGYAVQRMADYLSARGVRHALVSAGASSIVALGGRGWGWSIDLCARHAGPAREDADSSPTRLARLYLRNGALGTSGAGEQFVEIDGRRYGHVLDPRTGWPASGVRSASVVARDGATADALATAFLVGGADLARAYCATHPDTLALITAEGASRPELFGAFPGVVVEDP
jgi:thiamine biosynthesis lipoprotein